MNRIVREHYPVSDLPDDLKSMVPEGGYVRVVLEPIVESDAALGPGDEPVLSLEELIAMRLPPYRTTDEIVAELHRQRDDWDD